MFPKIVKDGFPVHSRNPTEILYLQSRPSSLSRIYSIESALPRFLSRDTGLASIELLISSNPSITHILLETSGLADPGNLAPLFWVDDGLGSNIYLDGIVTLVDARNILTSLEELPTEGENGDQHLTTAHMQISHADVLIVNKSDTVSPSDLEAVRERVGSINGLAKMHVTQYSKVPRLESFLLDIHAYDGVDTLENVSRAHSHIDPVRITPLSSGVENERDKLNGKERRATNDQQSISTTSLPLPLVLSSQLSALESWLRLLLWENTLLPPLHPLPSTATTSEPHPPPPTKPTFSIHRTKGLITTTDGKTKMLQGVREVFEIVDLDPPPAGTENDANQGHGKIVFIGRGIAGLDFKGSLARALRETGD